MDEPTHHAPAPTAGASTTTEETMAVIAAEEPHGVTADQVARALGLGVDGALVQDELEDLVARGLLDRRGLGYGAIYTLTATGATETAI